MALFLQFDGFSVHTLLEKTSEKVMVELSPQPERPGDKHSKHRAPLSVPTDVQGLMASFFKWNQLEKQMSFLQPYAKSTAWTNSFIEGEVGCFWLEVFELAETCEEKHRSKKKNPREQEDWRRRK